MCSTFYIWLVYLLPIHSSKLITVKILAIETTDAVGSVAAMADDNLLLELDLNQQQRSAQSLPPGMKTLMEQVGWKPDDVDLVALTIGPGSFTGLRVGVAMAKTFAYAVGAEILGVNTLDSIAEAAPTEVSSLMAVIDAQRGDIVSRSFNRSTQGFLVPNGEQQLISIDRWLEELPNGMVVTGPVLTKIAQRLPNHVAILDKPYWTPKAGMVAKLANRQYTAGRRDDLWKLAPKYSRRSAAEEKWDKKSQ
jgi:tRNA threonylcarbamoyladenosine biosynthesis protein TsaB